MPSMRPLVSGASGGGSVRVGSRLNPGGRTTEAGSPGGCSGGAGSCDPIQISVHVGARGAGCSPDGVGG
jgi:hypothetical protein